MKPRRLVAVIGVSMCGKSLLTRRLQSSGFHRHRFADPVRAMLEPLGLKQEQMNNESRSEGMASLSGKSPQQLVRSLSEWGRSAISPTVWIERWEADLSRLEGDIFVDDIMRANEVEAVQRSGGAVVKVNRPALDIAVPRRRWPLADITPDVELTNAEDQTDFQNQIERLISALKIA